MTLRTSSGNISSNSKCHVVNTWMTATSTSKASMDYDISDVGFTSAACIATMAHEDYASLNIHVMSRMVSDNVCRVTAISATNGFTSGKTYVVNLFIIGH